MPIPPRSSQSRTAPTSRPRSWRRSVFQEFLPRQLTPEELEAEVRAVIAQVGATSVKEMGKVMGVVTKKLAGRADGKDISAKVRELLS